MSSSLNNNESSKEPSPSIVKLNSNANDSRVCYDNPPTVLLHGLDSSSHTWRNILEDLGEIDYSKSISDSQDTGLRALSIDQRGCGLSPLGDPNDFTPDALVEDLYAVLANHPLFRIEPTTSEKDGQGVTAKPTAIRPFVLVGHSMGGRIAMSFAAKYPELIVALVIEDMDIRKRLLKDCPIRSSDRARTLEFDRNLPGISTPQGVIDKFVNEEGYPSSQVQKWLNEGRVETVGNSNGYYSQVHPAFRLLCYEQFFETNHGEDTWNDLAGILEYQDTIGQHKFDVHLMIADSSMTVCSEESIAEMVEDFCETPQLLHVHWYPGATHSIHNSQRELFVTDLKKIIRGERILRRYGEAKTRRRSRGALKTRNDVNEMN